MSTSQRLVLFLGALLTGLLSLPTHAAPLPGQIIQDPDHPQWMRRHEGPPFYLCAPGGPEDFLFRGRPRGPDDRGLPPPWSNDQDTILGRLINEGGNGIYLMTIRSNGGDGPNHHQPFIGGDADNGADPAILDHWMTWFDVMEANDIVIYLFFYDDYSIPYGVNTNPTVSPEEDAYWRQIVNHFEHYRNLVWVITEELHHGWINSKVENLAQIIQEEDDHGHLIGTHHWDPPRDGTPTRHFRLQDSEILGQWLIELSPRPVDQLHNEMLERWGPAVAGGYGLNMAEMFPSPGRGDTLRLQNWAFALAGAQTMWLYAWERYNPTVDELSQMRPIQRLMEHSDHPTMAPHDELAFGETKWVLADPGRSFIAYSDNAATNLGVRGTAPGLHYIHWVDPVTGATVDQLGADSPGGDTTWTKPAGFGNEVAAWIIVDEDGDGVVDKLESSDNCPTVANPDQLDQDGDGLGDACDDCPTVPGVDADGDFICSNVDNCVDVANPDQADADGDGAGDACDSCPFDAFDDSDRDGICADLDNCPTMSNGIQTDTDGDGPGDACDPCPYDALDDGDADGFCANVDNCPTTANALQVDLDGDGAGDSCDPCPLDALDDGDGDGFCANLDNCPELPNPAQDDLDGDARGDDCDLDIDGDGAPNDLDCAPRDFGDGELAPALGGLRAWLSAAGPSGVTSLRWDRPAAGMSDPDAVHEIVVGELAQLHADRGFDAACRVVASERSDWSDRRGLDSSWYYLVRGVNDCGTGPLATASLARDVLDARTLDACP
ncbi:MAG: thrombospondin type 3 repeat-containing protein [Acidobacteriota bacterium]